MVTAFRRRCEETGVELVNRSQPGFENGDTATGPDRPLRGKLILTTVEFVTSQVTPNQVQ
jgi:hypothetical protein